MSVIESRPSRHYFPQVSSVYAFTEPLAYPLMRIVTGLFLAPHGAQKLFGWFGGNPEQIAALFGKLGFNPGYFWMITTGAVELVGGLLIVLGLFTRPAAVACFVLLAVAAYIQAPFGWFWTGRGAEFAVFWALMCLGVAMGGGGALSMDARMRREF